VRPLTSGDAGMPFLDAEALKSDPEGLAFLRSVIAPQSKCSWPGPKAGNLLVRTGPRWPDNPGGRRSTANRRFVLRAASVSGSSSGSW
jgi:hypothetical protein